MKPQLATESLVHLLEQQDLEQMRQDNRRLVAENALLRQRVAELEQHIVTHAWTDFVLH